MDANSLAANFRQAALLIGVHLQFKSSLCPLCRTFYAPEENQKDAYSSLPIAVRA
jgi:hypothetical protein